MKGADILGAQGLQEEEIRKSANGYSHNDAKSDGRMCSRFSLYKIFLAGSAGQTRESETRNQI
jgi:hypothetical protein